MPFHFSDQPSTVIEFSSGCTFLHSNSNPIASLGSDSKKGSGEQSRRTWKELLTREGRWEASYIVRWRPGLGGRELLVLVVVLR